MEMQNPTYSAKKAIETDICLHLKECDNDFIPPLSEKVNINEYSKKIFEKSITFEAWAGHSLVGLVATYFNDENGLLGYITNVSVIKKFTGLNIGSTLMKMCIGYAIANNFKNVMLEVNKNNEKAINLYKKIGFKEKNIKDDLLTMNLVLNYKL